MQTENAVTGQRVNMIRKGALAIRQSQAEMLAGDHSRKVHYGYAKSSARGSIHPRRALRFSLATAILGEIRNLAARIGEIRSRQQDRQGISIDPSRGISLPPEQREIALACCIQGMRSLYKSRCHTTSIDAELYFQGWLAGVASARRNWSIQPRA